MSHVNHEHRHVFIHVPKTGGTSMSHLPWIRGGDHGRARDLVPQAPQYFSWGFVRCPYDRLVSVYHAAVQHGQRWPAVEEAGSFAEFVRRIGVGRWQVAPHALPMTHFLCGDSGRVVVDFVGRFERIEADFGEVCRRLGQEERLPHRNATDHPPWPELYTPDLVAIVNRVYASDFTTFGYERIDA